MEEIIMPRIVLKWIEKGQTRRMVRIQEDMETKVDWGLVEEQVWRDRKKRERFCQMIRWADTSNNDDIIFKHKFQSNSFNFQDTKYPVQVCHIIWYKFFFVWVINIKLVMFLNIAAIIMLYMCYKLVDSLARHRCHFQTIEQHAYIMGWWFKYIFMPFLALPQLLLTWFEWTSF